MKTIGIPPPRRRHHVCLEARFTDSLRRTVVQPRVEGRPYITRICGPVGQVDDTTFVVDFYRMGTDNVRRRAEMCLVACYDGDAHPQGCSAGIHPPHTLSSRDGRRQCLLFPGIDDVVAGTDVVELRPSRIAGCPCATT